jgi:hypothetical protein
VTSDGLAHSAVAVAVVAAAGVIVAELVRLAGLPAAWCSVTDPVPQERSGLVLTPVPVPVRGLEPGRPELEPEPESASCSKGAVELVPVAPAMDVP